MRRNHNVRCPAVSTQSITVLRICTFVVSVVHWRWRHYCEHQEYYWRVKLSIPLAFVIVLRDSVVDCFVEKLRNVRPSQLARRKLRFH